MINVRISEETLLEMLCDRVAFWTDNEEVQALFNDMYESEVYNGCFDGCEFDVDVIVDNDYVNYCSVLEKGDDEYDKVLELAKNGEYDISCETCYSFIEAHNEDYSLILVRN